MGVVKCFVAVMGMPERHMACKGRGAFSIGGCDNQPDEGFEISFDEVHI
jgi:hypothetical protein